MDETPFNGVHAHQLSESCSINPDASYTPQIMDSLKPKVGQEFDTLDDVYQFYNSYARQAGFGVRIGSSNRNRSNEITRKEYLCYKEGQRRVNTDKPELKRIRATTCEYCRAKISVVNDSKSGKFKISVFIEEHSHPLATPKKVHFLRSHRSVSLAQRSLTQQLSSANIPTHQQISILELQAGGLENIGCVEKDIRNVKRDMKKVMDGHDATMLNDYFMSEQEKNPSFTYTIEVDSENCITRCFWSDATSRKAYKSFGDVIVFDTTYQTNKYAMIFAPLLGVNHHGQTILFGSAFLSDETTESFVWLFEEWMKAMSGDPPSMIITDQDPAMAKAIERMLPKTFHRFCIWHIMNKFSEKLSATAYSVVHQDLKKYIWDSESREEFEMRWMDVLVKGGLQENVWLKTMYTLRGKWVPAYVKHVFAAGMSSSQRAESSHAFFKRYLNKNNSLTEFIACFDRALSNQRHQELSADHVDIDAHPILKTPIIMEKQMSSIYTQSIFKKFQNEVFQSIIYSISCVGEDNTSVMYDVEHASGDDCIRKIVEAKSTRFSTCSCQLFEWEGIPCRHLVAFLNSKKIYQLPDCYIKVRWTKGAKMNGSVGDNGVNLYEMNTSSILLRRNQHYQRFRHLVDKASLSEERSKKLDAILDTAEVDIERIPLPTVEGPCSQTRNSEAQVFGDPKKVRVKGCGKRLKGGKEKAMAKLKTKENRKCNACGQVGMLPDKRNCPGIQNHGSQQASTFDDDYISTGAGGV